MQYTSTLYRPYIAYIRNVTIEIQVAVNTNVISSFMKVQGVIVDNGVKIFHVVNFVF